MAPTVDRLPDDRRWRLAVVAIAIAALAVRLAIIAHSGGGADIRIYRYFATLALRGLNPFAPPPGGAFPSLESDNPPAEIAAYAGVLALHNAPVTLRALFAAFDAATVLVVGLGFRRSRAWRASFVAFYAFNPFVLVAWTGFSEDATIVFFLIAVLFWCVERGHAVRSWAALAVLAAFKFLGLFAAPVLALWSARGHRRAAAPALLAAFAAAVAASYLPWFPATLETFARRDVRLSTNPPIHASVTILLSRLHLYAPWEARALIPASVAAIVLLYAGRRLGTLEAIAWSLAAAFAFLPNNAFHRILLMTLPFLLIVPLRPGEWAAIWAASSLAALAAVVATRGVPAFLEPANHVLTALFARESTVRHVLWMNLLPAIVLAFYLRNRRALVVTAER